MLGLISEWMVVTDPPAHTRLRRLAGGRVQGAAHLGHGAADPDAGRRAVDGFLAGAGDLIAGVAYPLPATVIADDARRPGRATGTGSASGPTSWPSSRSAPAERRGPTGTSGRCAGCEEMDGYFRELVALRRREPGEDMLSGDDGAEDTTAGGIEEHG